MIELQVINYILDTKNLGAFLENGIDLNYFTTYKNEFEFINKHNNDFGVVCDKATFISAFPDFDVITVNEPLDFLIDKLHENYVYSDNAKFVNQLARILEQDDSRVASDFIIQKANNLCKSKKLKAVDLVSQADIRYQKYLDRIENRNRYFITTGFKEIDELTGGWDSNEDFVVISARTNHGKSWFLDYFLISAMVQGKTVGLFSGEMSEDKVGYRIDTLYSNLSNFKISKGYVDIKDQYASHIEMFQKLNNKFWVVTPEMLNGRATISNLKAFCLKYGIELLGIDQYSLLEDSDNNKISHERYANISKQIKMMQTQLKIPILVAAQLNRGIEKGKDADTVNLAGSDRIAQDATKIINITPKEPYIELRGMKDRDGSMGWKLLYNWNIDLGVFSYIPVEDDANHGKGVKEIQDKYKGEKNPF